MPTLLTPSCVPLDCEGERGERGKRGKRGKRGHRGHDGHDGRDGRDGETGATGPTGPTGPIGDVGATGPTGVTGPAGSTEALPFAGSWRIQWNGGDPIVTVKDVVAPPGIFVGLRALSNRGECELFVFGDPIQIDSGAVAGSIGIPAIGTLNEFLVTMLQGFDHAGSWVVLVDALGVTGPDPADVAQAQPPLPPVVPGQPILEVTVRTRYQSDGTTNNTAALLEDISMSFSGSVSLVGP